MLAAALTGLGQAPSITTQPQGQQVAAGANVTLSVAAIGAAPLSFQWLLNGFALSGKTNANLMLNAVRVTETGSYQVWVQNSRGTARSQIARLEVGNPLAFSLPIALTGWNEDVVLENAVTRSLTRDFDSSGASWFEAGLDDHADGLPASGTFASVANTNVVFRLEPYTNANVLRLSATNASGALILTAPGPYLIVSVLAASGNGRGFGALMLHFSDGSSSPAMGFDALDWFDQSPSLAIAGLGRDQFAGSELEYQSGGNGFGLFQTDIDLRALGLSDRTLTGITFLKPAGPSVTGIFAVSGVPNSVGAPIIIAQPQSRTVSKGSAVTFEVLASGASPLQYQWRFNRTNLSDDGNIIGSASARLTILSAQTNQNAYYSVAVSNSMGSATSQDAMLTVLGNPAAPGTKLWEVATGGPIASSPALATDGTIYIGSDDGKLWAINPDGTAKWRFPIGPQVKSSPGIGADGTIYVGSISPSNRLYAVDTNGIEKWEFAAGGPITTTPAIAADGTIYVTAQAGTLFALNADGTKRWEFPLGSQFPSSPALGTDGAVYVGSGHNDPELFYNLGEFYAIYPDGTRKWTFNARGPFASPAIGSNGIIYVGSFDNEGKLYAFDKQGHKLWEFRTGASIGNQPVIGLDGTIYFANLNQVFWAIAPDGTRRWTLPYLGAPAAGANAKSP